MGKLTTHVLDTANGMPGAGIHIALYRVADDQLTHVTSAVTNEDGRTDAPLLEGTSLETGKYQLVFDTAAYFRARNTTLEEIPFLDDVVIRFGINNSDQHYHVPLLVSPYSFSTYRGS
ncbi:hydroxyisourate hydrolase [Parasalinivibrio latis]|uniref:hydroxyisourate hydrolase n=1 Tax=Parasalinivibrio latis TaxID=2952610 RepID=UPI0030DE8482